MYMLTSLGQWASCVYLRNKHKLIQVAKMPSERNDIILLLLESINTRQMKMKLKLK